MVGTNFHNDGDSYYSFAHTLPGAHLINWECSFRAPGAAEERLASRALATAATVSLSGFLSVTTCRVPAGSAAAALLSSTDGDEGPLELTLSALQKHSWSPEPLRLCAVPLPPRRFLSACSATLHSADYVHKLFPHAVEDWLNYHFLLGIEHFTIYDTDGSYEPYLAPFIQQGRVTYHPRFPAKVAPKLGDLTAGLKLRKENRPMLMEPHALEHCVWENRQVSDWVVVIHSWEEYLHSQFLVDQFGSANIREVLRIWTSEVPGTSVFELFQ
ncbi:unnamed protein product, partial [Polarella glacialis]